MPRRNEKRPHPAGALATPPGSSFRWPSRRLADAAEQAASAAAEAGLERLRARAPRPVRPEPPAPVLERLVPRAEVPQRVAPVPEPERKPAPEPWDAELDELTEQLVAELRRDLGPETF